MARKRLSPPFGNGLAPASDGAERAGDAAALMPSPISRVAAEASAAAALETLAGEVASARAEGRMVEALPISQVQEGYLVRDRAALDEAELGELMESLRQHGQRTPIDVVDLGQGRYGLISGWRRLTALRRLHAETGEARFAHVLGLLRRPEAAGDAYVAMVEENEIRAGLSYYERARIVALAVEAGVFVDEGTALRTLYATASRAKRSKIRSFMAIHEHLGSVLRFPAAISERLGLALASQIAAPDFVADLAARLGAAAPAQASEEIAVLTSVIEEAENRPGDGAQSLPEGEDGAEVSPRPAPRIRASRSLGQEMRPGLHLSMRAGGITLSGPAVDAAFRARLEAWLRGK